MLNDRNQEIENRDGPVSVRRVSVSPLNRSVDRLRLVHDSRQPISAEPTAAAVAYCLAAVGGVGVVALLMFYGTEVAGPPPYTFGALSDITGAAWNLLLIPLVIGLGAGVLPARTGGWILFATTASSGTAAVGSALLVVGVLPFGVSTAISVSALMVQAGWLVAVGTGLRRVRGWQRLGRGGRWIGVGVWAGAILVAASLLFGWGTPAQVIVMITGIVPGLLAWMAWPIWVFSLARQLSVRYPSAPFIDHRGAS